MQWSPQQNEALSKAAAWLRMKWQPTFYLAGYAGSGKTTLAMHIAAHAKGKVAYAAFTGKAARVMRQKGCHAARTIHSTIYWTEHNFESNKIEVHLKDRSDLEWCSMFVIDEVSMVNEQLAKDLLSFGKPILVLGDPAQLPPVSGAGYFTSRQPDYMLTEVHRQAAESPIIRIATHVREGRFRGQPLNEPGLTVVPRHDLDPLAVTSADTVIVGRNDTRRKFNTRLREIHGYTSRGPEVGETLICLRNDKMVEISNGETFVVDGVQWNGRAARVKMTVSDPDDPKRQPVMVEVRKEFFQNDEEAARLPPAHLTGSQHFTYGYAITGHKSQGSQWPKVCVFDESRVFREDASRWLYTAITRASEQLTLVV